MLPDLTSSLDPYVYQKTHLVQPVLSTGFDLVQPVSVMLSG